MSKVDYNTLLTKITNVFKTDMIIYKYQYCIGGEESEEKNEGEIICTLTPSFMNLIKTMFPMEEYIYFKDIKKLKKEGENDYLELIHDKKKMKEIEDKVEKLTKLFSDKDKWLPILFTEEDVNELFIEKNLVTLFKNDSKAINLDIAKSALPLISEKNCLDTTILYHYIKPNEEGIATALLSYKTDWFMIDEVIRYLPLE